MCGGKGIRLQFEGTEKPLIILKGKAMIEYVLDALIHSQKFPELKRTAKTTKKITLKYSCRNCKRQTMKEGMRMHKLEIQP